MRAPTLASTTGSALVDTGDDVVGPRLHVGLVYTNSRRRLTPTMSAGFGSKLWASMPGGRRRVHFGPVSADCPREIIERIKGRDHAEPMAFVRASMSFIRFFFRCRRRSMQEKQESAKNAMKINFMREPPRPWEIISIPFYQKRGP